MVPTRLIAAAALLALLPAGAAQAQVAVGTTQEDLRCVAVIATIMAAQDQPDPAMFAGFLYFMGRIEGREPGYKLESNLVTLLSRPDVDTILKANAERCGDALIERGDFIKAVGERWQNKPK